MAAPPKGEDGDWRAGRSGSNRRGGEDREPAPELDWGAARNSQAELPPRQRSNRLGSGSGPSGESSSSSRPSRRQEAELDWGSARNSRDGLPPQEKDQIEHQENKNQNLIGILLETLKLNYLLEKEKDHKENPDGTPEKTLLDKHQESKNQNLIGVLPETLKPVYHQEKDLIELVPTVAKIN